MKKYFSTLFLSLIVFFTLGAVVVYAQNTPVGGGNSGTTGGNPTQPSGKLPNPFKYGDSLYTLLEKVITDILLPIGGVLATLAFIYAGFKYVMAQGSQTKIAEAHRTLLYAAIGTAVLMGAWTIAKVIQNTLNSVIS